MIVDDEIFDGLDDIETLVDDPVPDHSMFRPRLGGISFVREKPLDVPVLFEQPFRSSAWTSPCGKRRYA